MGNSESDQPLVGDLLGELAVLGRIDLIDAAAEDGDGVAADLEHGSMRRRIDSARHAADDGQAAAARSLASRCATVVP